jgi:hypothetical protein
MTKKLNPRKAYYEALEKRKSFPLRLLGSPYKLIDARSQIASVLETAEAALNCDRDPAEYDAWDCLGLCLAAERHMWARQMLGEWIPHTLGYDAVPGLEATGRRDLANPFVYTVLKDILPSAASGLSLAKGEPKTLRLIEVLTGTLTSIDEALAGLEVDNA